MITLQGKYNRNCKIFIDNVEDEALELVRSILDKEISENVPVRIMPDTHVGKGIVIGFTMPLTSMVNPNYIGVDIGCSVSAYKLNKRINSDDFPDLDKHIRRVVPMGKETRNKTHRDEWWISQFFDILNKNLEVFILEWERRFNEKKQLINVDRNYITELCKKVVIGERLFYNSVGSLGGGNHFIEIGESVNDGSHYLTFHSGSRNFGLKVCNYHAKKMTGTKFLPKEYHDEFENIRKNTKPTSDIPSKIQELQEKYQVGKKEYFLKGEDMYEYMLDMVIAQTYAQFNHKVMAKVVFNLLGDEFNAVESIFSMHNFIDTSDWIIRKGAIRAYEGEKILIPFNMRDGILICEGKSNEDWNYSAPHGAGRVLSRSKASKTLSLDEFSKEMAGIYSTSVCRDTLDESPMAYKDKNVIMNAIKDTAVILDTLKPMLNIKALS